MIYGNDLLSDEVVEDDGSGEVAHIMGLCDGEISVPAKVPSNNASLSSAKYYGTNVAKTE